MRHARHSGEIARPERLFGSERAEIPATISLRGEML
jgi:hypothetical protein